MSPIQIQIIGDSHVDAVKRALATAGPDEAVTFKAERILRLKDDKQIGDIELADFMQRIGTLGSHDVVASVVGGHQYNSFGLVQHPQAFDFHCPERPELPPLPAREIVPYQVLRDIFESSARGKEGERIQTMARHTAARVVHLCPPPPKEDGGLILRHHETLFLKQGLLEHGVTPATIRLKLWTLQTSVLRALCSEWGVELLLPPPGTQSAQGYLAEAFSADDATHANPAYAALMLAQLKQLALNLPRPERLQP